MLADIETNQLAATVDALRGLGPDLRGAAGDDGIDDIRLPTGA